MGWIGVRCRASGSPLSLTSGRLLRLRVWSGSPRSFAAPTNFKPSKHLCLCIHRSGSDPNSGPPVRVAAEVRGQPTSFAGDLLSPRADAMREPHAGSDLYRCSPSPISRVEGEREETRSEAKHARQDFEAQQQRAKWSSSSSRNTHTHPPSSVGTKDPSFVKQRTCAPSRVPRPPATPPIRQSVGPGPSQGWLDRLGEGNHSGDGLISPFEAVYTTTTPSTDYFSPQTPLLYPSLSTLLASQSRWRRGQTARNDVSFST